MIASVGPSSVPGRHALVAPTMRSGSGISFAEFVTAPGVSQDARRTVSFSALGPFGRSHPVEFEGPAETPQDRLHDAHTYSPEDVVPDPEAAKVASFAVNATRARDLATPAPQPETLVQSTGVAALDLVSGSPEPLMSLTSRETLPARDRTAGDERSSVRTPQAPSPRTQPSVSLIINGSGAALEIIARTQGNTPGEREHLRKRVAAAAADLGFSVTSLRLNGSSVDFTTIPQFGGRNGYRTD